MLNLIMSSKIYKSLGILLWSLATVFALLPSWPHFYYRLNTNASESLANTLATTTITPQTSATPTDKPGKEQPTPKVTPTATPKPPTKALPELDLTLPAENGLIINKIGVKGQINEGEDWENLLRQGIWRVPEFATPVSENNMPIILAAHRWGYLEWSAGFRKLNSFYNLPKLKPGDEIELVWEQRKYTYQVTKIGTGTEIEDYDHNLILYTCQLWNSPVRFFVYATRTN